MSTRAGDKNKMRKYLLTLDTGITGRCIAAATGTEPLLMLIVSPPPLTSRTMCCKKPVMVHLQRIKKGVVGACTAFKVQVCKIIHNTNMCNDSDACCLYAPILHSLHSCCCCGVDINKKLQNFQSTRKFICRNFV